MIELLFLVIVLGLVAWAVSAFEIPQPFRTVAFVILALILVLYIGKHFFGLNLHA